MKITVLSSIITAIGLMVTAIFLIMAIKKKEKLPVLFTLVSSIITAISALIANFDIDDIDVYPDTNSIPIETMITFDSSYFYKVYYTVDGSNAQNGIKYEEPFAIDADKIIDGKIKICYTAKIGPFYLDHATKEYKIIFDSPQKDIDNNEETLIDNNNDATVDNIGSEKTNEVIVDADKKVFIPDNSEIVLRSASGYFLSLNEDGNYYANKSVIDNSCLMKINLTNDGYTGLYNIQSGTYATAAIDKDPVVLCSVNTYMQSWECFSLYQDNVFITISSQGKERNNDEYKYVTSDEDDVNRAIYVRAKDAKAWEDFSIFIYSPDDGIWENPFTSETILDNGYH